MLAHMNALYKIACKLDSIDPLIAYEFSENLRTLVAADRRFKMDMISREKNLSNQSDQIELVENREGGWDWIHTNVDGHGTRDTTGWRLQPSEVLKMIDQSIQPGPMTDEVKALLEQEISSGAAGGIPRGSEMIGGPSALAEVPLSEIPSAVVEPGDRTWERDSSPWGHELGADAQKLIKKAIHVAHSRPELRPALLPILRKLIKR